MKNTTDYSNLSTSTPEAREIVSYLDLPDWFNDAYNTFYFIISILQFVALVINLTHLTILTRKEMRSNAIYRLMIGICLCDIVSQIMSFISFSPFWIRSIDPGEECYVTTSYLDALINKYGIGILDDTQRSSTWLGVWMALYRVLAVMFPMSGRVEKLTKPVVVPIACFLTVSLNGLVSMAAMWHLDIVRQRMDYSCDGTQHLLPESKPRYFTYVPSEDAAAHNQIVLYYGIIKAFPSLLEFVLAILLIIQLGKAAKRRKRLSKSEGTDNTTKLILIVTLSSFVLEVPNGFAHFSFSLFEDSRYIRTIATMIESFSEIFPFTNSCIHPFVCFFMSSQYREVAKSLFWKSNNQNILIVEECTAQPKTDTANKTV